MAALVKGIEDGVSDALLRDEREVEGDDPVLPAVEDAGGDADPCEVGAAVLVAQGAGGLDGGDARRGEGDVAQPSVIAWLWGSAKSIPPNCRMSAGRSVEAPAAHWSTALAGTPWQKPGACVSLGAAAESSASFLTP